MRIVPPQLPRPKSSPLLRAWREGKRKPCVCSLLLVPTLGFAQFSKASEGIGNHLILDLAPLAQSASNPIGGAVGLAYDRYHEALKSSYLIAAEISSSYSFVARQTDFIFSLGLFTEITRAFSIGGRIGRVFNHPDNPTGFGAIALRLPALFPKEKKFFSFFYEEVDLGISGSGERNAAFRLGMLLF